MRFCSASLLWSFLFLFLFTSAAIWAKPTEWPRRDSLPIKPLVMLQLWSTYTQGQQVWREDLGRYEGVDDRLDLQLRRARLGFRGEPYRNLSYTLLLFYDLIGRDLLSGVAGGTNGPTPQFGVWDAFLQWRVCSGSEALYLTAGYFRPQLGRESITSAWSVNSFEKATIQTYLRHHLVGTGPGRATGINLGGLLRKPPQLGLSYNLGLFLPQYTDGTAQTAGVNFAPLWVGRAVLHLGDPEQTRYRIGYEINYFGQRQGLSLGVGGSWQGETDWFASSKTLSFDLLANYGPFNLDGEVVLMEREGRRELPGGVLRSFTYRYGTAHLRGGINVPVGRYLLEPSFMVAAFRGADDPMGQSDAAAIGASAGAETTYDLGLNWYLDGKRLKLALHHTWSKGEAGAADPGNMVNAFFSQPGVGAIQRGHWWGLGLSLIF